MKRWTYNKIYVEIIKSMVKTNNSLNPQLNIFNGSNI